MTAVPKDPQISELRELFRHLREFRAVYETTGLVEVETPYGNTWSLWDLEYLYQQACRILTFRQAQAIKLCLVDNMREKDAAIKMAVSPTNPVMMYATLGIRRLLDAIESGEISRFRHDATDPDHRTFSLNENRLRALHKIAGQIKSHVDIAAVDCWAYRYAQLGSPPRVLVRSPSTSSGFVAVHPMRITFEAYVQAIPPGFTLVHREGLQHLACVNYEHGVLVKLRNY